MKRNRLIQFILVFLTTTACAQNREACNRSVWTKEDAKYLPKEVCIKKGDYHITQVYKSVDLNGDGLMTLFLTGIKILCKTGIQYL